MRTNRLIAMLLVVVMLMQTISFALTPNDFTDFPAEDNWAFEAMDAALKNDLLQGKGDGIIAPSANLTRAEFAAVVTRAFGATVTSDISFLTDVKAGDWFFDDNSVSKAYHMGVMNGTSDTTFHPNDNMRREDVFLTLARALFVSGTDEEILSKFEDNALVDSWAKEALIGMVDESYVNGYHDEENDVWTLKPRASITRAELAQVFHNLFKYYISAKDVTEANAGVFGGTDKENRVVFDGSVVVRTPDVTLQNAVIEGDLVVADGVGNGEFKLINTHVKGNIIIRGGEGKVGEREADTERLVDFVGVKVDGNVIVNNVNGTVNFHNYKSDFEKAVVENTPATYLPTGGSSGGSGVISRIPFKVVRHFEPLEDGVDYDDYITGTDDYYVIAQSVTKGSTVYPNDIANGVDHEGFEIDTDHDNYDEYLSGVKVNVRNTVFDVYYKRLTYTVKFGDISEETYKYGYELTLDDIPEDSEVAVDDDEKFLGWSTNPTATTGTSRNDLVGTKVTEGVVYYPVIVDKDAVVYYTEHYFEALELNNDGTPKYELYQTDENYGKITTSVVAEYLDEVGFEKITYKDQLLSGQIPKPEDGVLTLKVYYNRKMLTVSFYDATSDFYSSQTQTYSQPSAQVKVRYGTAVDADENLDKYIQAETTYEDNNFYFDRGYEQGFWREPAFGNVYNSLGGKVYHEIPLYWWYENAESGEFEKFYVEGGENSLVFTSDVDVYSKSKRIDVRLLMDDFKYEGYFYAYYDDDTRFIDTVKDMLFVNGPSIIDAVEIAEIEDKSYSKLADKGIFHEVGGKYEISNFNKLIKFTRLMGEQEFENFLQSFIDDSAVTKLEDFLFDYITTHDIDETAEHLKELVDDLIVGHEDIAHQMMNDLAADIIEKDISHVEQFFMTYTTSLVDANDTDDLEKMICEMFADYKKTNEAEFVAFVTDVVVKALSEDTPNADVVKMIEDYIKSETKKGTYNDEIIDYIMGMTDADFKSAAIAVINEDVTIIENDVKQKIITDDTFVKTIIDEIFAFDSNTVDSEIKKYIKNYNLVDKYIKNNPDVIVDYLTDEQIGEFYGSYIPGVTLTRNEKIDAVKQFIADDPDAVSKLKNYAGSGNVDTLVSKYYDENKDTVKSEMKTEVVSNPTLRTELAAFAIKLIKNDEFSDLLDFAIDDYLTDVLADDDKKLALAQKEVGRLSNDKVYNLDFVQDAISTVIDDIIADVKLYEKDGNDETESEYVADIKKYVKSINNFADIVDAFIHTSEEFRNDIIVKLFDNLYASDPDHTIILKFMTKVTDKMIEEGDIDINIFVTVIEYIRDMGEHGHELTRDIIDNLMTLGDDLVSYVEDKLGWIDNSGKLEASLKFKKEVTYEEKFEVTLLNDEFIMDKVAEKVEAMTFDAFMD
ncbi:MAG: S-layer homology domain-containing protein, partial [Clostridia bacterium]|nr:S-layer homology domain-containing protein [Clostridia bacterium]